MAYDARFVHNFGEAHAHRNVGVLDIVNSALGFGKPIHIGRYHEAERLYVLIYGYLLVTLYGFALGYSYFFGNVSHRNVIIIRIEGLRAPITRSHVIGVFHHGSGVNGIEIDVNALSAVSRAAADLEAADISVVLAVPQVHYIENGFGDSHFGPSVRLYA